jgi:hypothetical protein
MIIQKSSPIVILFPYGLIAGISGGVFAGVKADGVAFVTIWVLRSFSVEPAGIASAVNALT